MTSRKNDRQWDAVIRPRNGWFDINLRELAHYRDLIFLLVKRNITVLYKQTVLGPAWMLIQAALVMPLSVVLSKLFNFFVQFALFAVFLVYYAVQPNSPVHPNWQLIAFVPLVLIQVGMLGMGLGIIISSLTTRYRDLSLLVNLGVSLWMYATPIAYPASMVMENYPQLVGLYMLNPVTPIVEFFRAAFLGTESFSLAYMPLSVGMTLVFFVGGVLLFSRIEKTFMDTV